MEEVRLFILKMVGDEEMQTTSEALDLMEFAVNCFVESYTKGVLKWGNIAGGNNEIDEVYVDTFNNATFVNNKKRVMDAMKELYFNKKRTDGTDDN